MEQYSYTSHVMLTLGKRQGGTPRVRKLVGQVLKIWTLYSYISVWTWQRIYRSFDRRETRKKGLVVWSLR